MNTEVKPQIDWQAWAEMCLLCNWCPREATWFSPGHPGCTRTTKLPRVRCNECYQKALIDWTTVLASGISIRCTFCQQLFADITAFAPYRLL